jgi:hypothetical protein
MELRNLSRFLLTRKAISKFNRKSSFKLTTQRLTLLLVIHTMQRTELRTTQKAIHLKFAAIGCSIGWLNLLTLMQPLLTHGWIEKIGPLYQLTGSGIAAITELNKILSRERFDR